jgi:uncharacterized protein
MDWYRGQTVLITGASAGIGEEMARILAPAGARLLLTARSVDELGRLAAECRAAGAEAHIFPHDLARPGAAGALFETITEAGLPIDVLINNAGYGKMGPFEKYEADVYEDMLTLNITNLVSLTRLALPAMLAAGRGGVMNVASTAAFQPVPLLAAYGASKTFVKEFTQALHSELDGTGVHVTCLAPGPTETKFFKRSGQSSVPGGRAAAAPAVVARDGLEALAQNRRLRVSGLLNRIAAFGAQLAPTGITLRAAKAVISASE